MSTKCGVPCLVGHCRDTKLSRRPFFRRVPASPRDLKAAGTLRYTSSAGFCSQTLSLRASFCLCDCVDSHRSDSRVPLCHPPIAVQWLGGRARRPARETALRHSCAPAGHRIQSPGGPPQHRIPARKDPCSRTASRRIEQGKRGSERRPRG